MPGWGKPWTCAGAELRQPKAVLVGPGKEGRPCCRDEPFPVPRASKLPSHPHSCARCERLVHCRRRMPIHVAPARATSPPPLFDNLGRSLPRTIIPGRRYMITRGCERLLTADHLARRFTIGNGTWQDWAEHLAGHEGPARHATRHRFFIRDAWFTSFLEFRRKPPRSPSPILIALFTRTCASRPELQRS